MSASEFFLKYKKSFRIAGLSLLLLLIAFPLFLHLDSKPLREWDEARNAINAFEMSRTGNLLVRTYNYEPDLWETKPPLLVWLQTLGFISFGYGELAVRLPSAIAAFMLCFYLIYRYKNQSINSGIIASLIVVTSSGFIGDHAARTGDHDAMLICFSTIMLLSFFDYIHSLKSKDLFIFVLAFTAAVYTKSITPFIFIPGILIYLLSCGGIKSVLSDKKIYIYSSLAVLTIAVYYFFREKAGKGYLESVWHNELFPRYTNTSSRYQYNVNGYWYYLNELFTSQYSYWIYAFPLAVTYNFFRLKDKLFKLNLYLSINILSFFLIISAGTGNYWYDLPLIPMMALITGLAISDLLSKVLQYYSGKKPAIAGLYILLILLFSKPYISILDKCMNTDEQSAQVMYGYAFKTLESRHPEIKTVSVFDPLGYNYPLVFYEKLYSTIKGYKLSRTRIEDLKNFKGFLIVLDEQIPVLKEHNVAYTELFTELKYSVLRI